MPMNFSGRSVEAASRVIEIDDVLVPTIASAFRCGQRSEKILRLTSSFSLADSMTRSQSPSLSSVSAGAMRLSAPCRSSSAISLRCTWRARLPLMVASPALMRSPETSLSSTSIPASAATCAMPLPIWPAPITPILRIVGDIFSAWSLVRALGRSLTWVMLAMKPFYDDRGSDTTRLLAAFSKLGREFWKCLIEVRDKAVVGDLEDRRLLVLVDRHDHFRVLHAGEMLDRARDADRDVELRRHHLAGLPHLPVVRRIAGIDRCARRADRGAELVRHRLDVLGEILAALHRAAAGNDDLRRCQFRAFGLRQFLAHEARQAGIGGGGRVLDRSRTALAGRLEGRGAHRDDLLGVLRLHGLDRVAGIDRPVERVGRHHLDDVGDLHHVEQCCD